MRSAVERSVVLTAIEYVTAVLSSTLTRWAPKRGSRSIEKCKTLSMWLGDLNELSTQSVAAGDPNEIAAWSTRGIAVLDPAQNQKKIEICVAMIKTTAGKAQVGAKLELARAHLLELSMLQCQ